MNGGGQGQRRVRKRLHFIALALHGGIEDAHERSAHKRGGNIRPVVDVVKKPAFRGAELSSGQINGVDVEQQRHGGLCIGYLRVEHVRFPEAHIEALGAIRVFVEQITEVLGIRSFVCDGQQHIRPSFTYSLWSS